MPSSLKTPTIVAPKSASRRASASTRCLRVSIGTARPPLTWTSRWSRFLTFLGSGTTWNQMRGPPPSGSMMQSAPIPKSASGTPSHASSHPSWRSQLGWLKLISQSGSPEAGKQVRIGAVDDQLESNSHRPLPSSAGYLRPAQTVCVPIHRGRVDLLSGFGLGVLTGGGVPLLVERGRTLASDGAW